MPGLDPLLRAPAVLLLGEMHGTIESPAFTGRAVCLALAAGLPVTVALEIPLEEEPRIRAFLASSGSLADRASLLGGAFWQAEVQDGRSSQAMLELLEALRRSARAGRPVHLVLLDSTAFAGGPNRDRAMAGRLHEAVVAAPHDFVIALTGNLHTRIKRGTPWNRVYEPMGFVLTQLVPGLAVNALDVAYTGGAAWFCDTPQPASCSAKALKGSPDANGLRVTLFATPSADGYNGTYSVGMLTASLPATSVPQPAGRPLSSSPRAPGPGRTSRR